MKYEKLLNKYFITKIYWSRANSYFSIPINIFQTALLLTIWLKVWNINNYFLIGVLAVIFIAVIFYVGYLDVKYSIIKKETSFTNQFNPEIMAILNSVENKTIGGALENVKSAK